MIIEPCGGYNCISLINNTDLEVENEPTEEYDLNQCGRDHLFINKALQLKISTSVKNTLRPAEYPWLVSIQILPKQKSRFFSKGSYRKSFERICPYSYTLRWYTHSPSMDHNSCTLYV
jgi:hypothetical protein